MKSTFSSPMSATPAAEPMTSKDPPVPAQKAISCHRGESIGRSATGYMPEGIVQLEKERKRNRGRYREREKLRKVEVKVKASTKTMKEGKD